MIFTALFSIFLFILNLIFSLLPPLPDLPIDSIEVINDFLNLLQSGINIIGLFFPIDFMLTCALVGIALDKFDLIYKLIMFIISKIPFLNIKN